MLQTAIINDVNGDTYTAWLQQQVNCLFTKENTLGDLEVWAKYRWTINSRTFPDNIGASTLLIDACL
jgi:hypothetical protein